MIQRVGAVMVFSLFSTLLAADEPGGTPTPKAPGPDQLYEQFTRQMNGVKLVGKFTIVGKDDGSLTKEEYTISKVEKLPEGEKWLIHARIKYGQHDLALPLPLDVKWAGTTPVITLDDMTIPGLGTFSARVVIDRDRYAGTWQHDQVGGHLFGTIEKLTEPEAKAGNPADGPGASGKKGAKKGISKGA